jgi:hypothetical protein
MPRSKTHTRRAGPFLPGQRPTPFRAWSHQPGYLRRLHRKAENLPELPPKPGPVVCSRADDRVSSHTGLCQPLRPRLQNRCSSDLKAAHQSWRQGDLSSVRPDAFLRLPYARLSDPTRDKADPFQPPAILRIEILPHWVPNGHPPVGPHIPGIVNLLARASLI